MKLFLLALLAPLVLSACVTNPGSIPKDLSAPELIQRAQDKADWNRYRSAAVYYQAVINRFPEDRENTVAAEYEIAYIHFKQHKWARAEKEFIAILERYKGTDADLFPPAYRVLSQERLKDIQARKNLQMGKKKGK
jgi:outer membrane protein assembly factor BamD (BamD/ComL family)